MIAKEMRKKPEPTPSTSIASILNSFGCNVTEKDLKEPTMDIVIPIYKKFIECCVQIKANLCEYDPPVTLLCFTEDTVKAYSESFRFIAFFKTLLHFLNMCGLSPSLYEILKPTRKLFHKQISLIVNFARFEFNELRHFKPIQDEDKKCVEQINIIDNEVDECKIKMREARYTKEKKEQIVKSLETIIAELTQQLNQLSADSKISKEKLPKLKQDKTEVENQKKDFKSRQTQYDKKLNLLSKLTLRSPTRLNKECEMSEASIRDLKCRIESKEKDLENYHKTLFEKEKFCENYKIISDTLVNFYQEDVIKANDKMKDIGRNTQEITNRKYALQQASSILKTKLSEVEKIKPSIEKLGNELENERANFYQNEYKINSKMKDLLIPKKNAENNQSELIEKENNLEKLAQNEINQGLQIILEYKNKFAKLDDKAKWIENYKNSSLAETKRIHIVIEGKKNDILEHLSRI